MTEPLITFIPPYTEPITVSIEHVRALRLAVTSLYLESTRDRPGGTWTVSSERIREVVAAASAIVPAPMWEDASL